MKIELKHIAKKYPNANPLTDVNATINDGDVVAIIGPSGTGKSTLLRSINLLETPTGGEIIIDGLEITKNKGNFEKVRQKIGMVFQSYNLFGHLTVVENVMLALTEIKKMPRQKAYEVAVEKLKSVGLSDIALKYPDELSGGQKQRISIARAIAMDPDLILLDEPTSALDPTMVREVENVISNLAKTGKTMIIVTHEMRFARAISNRVFYLDKGVVYEEGTPDEIFENPKRERTKAFVNRLKVVKYKFNTNDFSYDEYHKEISNFIETNVLDTSSKICLSKLSDDIARFFIPKYMNENITISLILEHNSENNKARMLLYFFTKNEEVTSDIFGFVKVYDSNAELQSIVDKDFNYKVSVEL